MRFGLMGSFTFLSSSQICAAQRKCQMLVGQKLNLKWSLETWCKYLHWHLQSLHTAQFSIMISKPFNEMQKLFSQQLRHSMFQLSKACDTVPPKTFNQKQELEHCQINGCDEFITGTKSRSIYWPQVFILFVSGEQHYS